MNIMRYRNILYWFVVYKFIVSLFYRLFFLFNVISIAHYRNTVWYICLTEIFQSPKLDALWKTVRQRKRCGSDSLIGAVNLLCIDSFHRVFIWLEESYRAVWDSTKAFVITRKHGHGWIRYCTKNWIFQRASRGTNENILSGRWY